jgi:hypothetical protein
MFAGALWFAGQRFGLLASALVLASAWGRLPFGAYSFPR